ncbi:hypothetical protein GCM10020221_28650 [Streptomyces thioluteus]|uniref:Uncharacterized protein n=1 Tax=Streptomyces thioluteus TaxID=66431 RepID=A0ABN3WYR5_STRTU
MEQTQEEGKTPGEENGKGTTKTPKNGKRRAARIGQVPSPGIIRRKNPKNAARGRATARSSHAEAKKKKPKEDARRGGSRPGEWKAKHKMPKEREENSWHRGHGKKSGVDGREKGKSEEEKNPTTPRDRERR